jgi:hypothetical protein
MSIHRKAGMTDSRAVDNLTGQVEIPAAPLGQTPEFGIGLAALRLLPVFHGPVLRILFIASPPADDTFGAKPPPRTDDRKWNLNKNRQTL